ncbi:hypothetical protein [Agaribacterium haliotis]|uniref:hypothetical protein n=1 Tax=Agaribacterium haliotis TaxID=2013869 RepID=UPI000BB58CC3|nr:hypothetical protein [Agaribacterium haliotis]
MSKNKPSKDELLQELESIRDFLGSDADIDAIPTLTAVADNSEDGDNSFATQGAFEEQNLELELEPADETTDEQKARLDAELESELERLTRADKDELDLDSLARAESADEAPDLVARGGPAKTQDDKLAMPPHIQKTGPDGDLQTQVSIFDDASQAMSPIARSVTTTFGAINKAAKSSSDARPAAEENPFLPPHIRERLGKHRDIINEIQGQQANNYSELNIAEKTVNHDHDEVIDQLVTEFMPVIERRLRELLLQRIQEKQTKSD